MNFNSVEKISYDNIIKYNLDKLFSDEKHNNNKNTIIIEHNDILSLIEKYNIYNPVILDFANNDDPGCVSQYKLKGNTQEEILMKNTTLGKILIDNKKLYPLDVRLNRIRYYDYKELYSLYISNCLYKKNNFSVIVCAAINNPYKVNDKYYYLSDQIITRKKIKMILKIAIIKKHEYLITGLWGCGAFNNPIEIMEIWKEEISKLKNLKVIFSLIGEYDERINKIFNNKK